MRGSLGPASRGVEVGRSDAGAVFRRTASSTCTGPPQVWEAPIVSRGRLASASSPL